MNEELRKQVIVKCLIEKAMLSFALQVSNGDGSDTNKIAQEYTEQVIEELQ